MASEMLHGGGGLCSSSGGGPVFDLEHVFFVSLPSFLLLLDCLVFSEDELFRKEISLHCAL